MKPVLQEADKGSYLRPPFLPAGKNFVNILLLYPGEWRD